MPVGDDEEAQMKDEAAALEAHRSQEAEQHAGSSAHPPSAGETILCTSSVRERHTLVVQRMATGIQRACCVAGAESGQAVEDEDDDETCGFCRFMKAGGCKDEFNVRRSCLKCAEWSCGRATPALVAYQAHTFTACPLFW